MTSKRKLAREAVQKRGEIERRDRRGRWRCVQFGRWRAWVKFKANGLCK